MLVLSIWGTPQASAGTFDLGVPASWACTGSCGASAANGVVTMAPTGGSQYGWVSTSGGMNGVGLGIGGTNGSLLRSTLFSAGAGDALNFYFNYVSSDGAGYADYAWARLLDGSDNEVALLFTARTTPSGSAVPGFDVPPPVATLSPSPATILGGAPSWSPLGGSSGTCWDTGCGYTGWIQSDYTIAAAGTYRLEFGATNWLDTQVRLRARVRRRHCRRQGDRSGRRSRAGNTRTSRHGTRRSSAAPVPRLGRRLPNRPSGISPGGLAASTVPSETFALPTTLFRRPDGPDRATGRSYSRVPSSGRDALRRVAHRNLSFSFVAMDLKNYVSVR